MPAPTSMRIRPRCGGGSSPNSAPWSGASAPTLPKIRDDSGGSLMTDDELRARLEAHPEQLRTAMQLFAIDLRVLVDYLLDQLPAATLHVRATALVKMA